MAQEQNPYYRTGRTVGRAARGLTAGAAAGLKSPIKGAQVVGKKVAREADRFEQGVAKPWAAGLLGLDENVTMAPLPARPPAKPMAIAEPPTPGRGYDYLDPMALGSLGRVQGEGLPPEPEAPPAPVEEPRKPVAGHLQPGQMMVSGGMRPLPASKIMDERTFRNMAPEERDAYVQSTAALQALRKGEQESMPLQERSDALGAAADLADYDAATRGPGRLRTQLGLKQQEWEHPVSEMGRGFEREQTYGRYGYPADVAAGASLQRQGMVNQGLAARAQTEADAAFAREQEETRRAHVTGGYTRQSAAMKALTDLNRTKAMSPMFMDPENPPKNFDASEPELYNLAFGGGGAGMEQATDESPEQIAEKFRRSPSWVQMTPGQQRQWLTDAEGQGYLQLTETERQRLHAALGIR